MRIEELTCTKCMGKEFYTLCENCEPNPYKLQNKINQLQAENERLKSIAACAYCGKEFKKGEIEKIAEHATSCEKSPLIKMINELEERIKALEGEMSYWQVIKCRICGKLFRLYANQVYEGDPSCCPECNEKSGVGDWMTNEMKIGK